MAAERACNDSSVSDFRIVPESDMVDMERAELLERSRKTPEIFGVPSLRTLYNRSGRLLPTQPGKQDFLEMAYATVLAKNINPWRIGEEPVLIDPNQVVRTTKLISPEIFSAVRAETLFTIDAAVEFSDGEHVLFQAKSERTPRRERPQELRQDIGIIAAVVEQYDMLIKRIAGSKLQNPEDAEDIAQEVYIRLLTSDKQYIADVSQIASRLTAITRSAVNSEFRSRYAKKRGMNRTYSLTPEDMTHLHSPTSTEAEALSRIELEEILKRSDDEGIVPLYLAGYSIKTEIPLLTGYSCSGVSKKLNEWRMRVLEA